MGYPTVAYFDKKIVERTIENLNNASIKNDFTHLLNSLFGLIIIPNQMKIQGRRNLRLFDEKLSNYKELDFLMGEETFLDEQNEGIFKDKTERKFFHKSLKYEDLKFSDFINHLRNAIAHNGIRPIKDPENGNWYGIIFRNYKKDKDIFEWSSKYYFQILLTQTELKNLCDFLTSKYLDELK